MNQSFSNYLFNHRSNNTPITHTRIGNKDLNISGGSFTIQTDNSPEFYKTYYHHIFVENKKEYLTEKQNGMCIAIDFDFRYDYEINERQHGDDDRHNIIQMILDELKNVLLFEDGFKFKLFLMEKPNVNRIQEKNITKDGIHILINIQMEHALQEIMRENILPIMSSMLRHLPITNTMDTVYDETITRGTTNWQLFGSRKPDNEAYELVFFKEMEYDINEDQFNEMLYDAADFNLSADNFHELSVQNPNNPRLEINPKVIMKYLAKTQKQKPSNNTQIKSVDNTNNTVDMLNINNSDDLECAVKKMLDIIGTNEIIRQSHEYTQILPAKYYEAGSHLLNRKVAFALKATHECLFLSWVMLRSKADDFEFSSIASLYDVWTNHFNKTERDGLTARSIFYWAKTDANPVEFNKIKMDFIDYFVDFSIQTQTDYDVATVIHKVYGGEYVCADNKNKIWYRYENNKWIKDKGTRIRNAISIDIYKLYFDKSNKLYDSILAIDPKDEGSIKQVEKLKRKHKSVVEMCSKLKKTNDKNNILRECMDIFYDENFLKLLDTNVNLLACANGVIDLKAKEFRQGRPDDYITLSTNIDYVPCDVYNAGLDEFIRQLFPFEGMRKYMLDHLASTLFGEIKNQTLEIYKGEGSNGKSMLIDLMGQTLGDYKTVAPLSLICGERQQTGGTSSEIIQLKGVRYVVMCEPSKNTIINEGKMKEATGGDKITGRALYSEAEVFQPQFSLVVCTNVNLKVNATEPGTWRRIKICPFLSSFKDEDKIQMNEDGSPVNELEFVKNKELKSLLPSFAVPFLSLLVKIAFETNGIVNKCDFVESESKKYQDSEDPVGCFIDECVINCQGINTTKTVLSASFKVWYEANYTRSSINMKELNERLAKDYDCDNKRFYNLKLVGDAEEEEDGHSHTSREDKFVAEFNETFMVCLGNEKYFIPSVAITEWAKMKGLQIHSSKDINPLLYERFGLDVKNKSHYKNKKIEGKVVNCWFGLCFKSDYAEDREPATKKNYTKDAKQEAESRRKIAMNRYEELGEVEDKTAEENMEFLQLKVRLRL
jgi:P4 family phage/plasmid primase-like protien